ncbi:hypothetical protein [Methylobacterium sp. JK268]
MADHTIKPATPDAPSAHIPGQGPGAGPERNLHQDHDTVRAQAGTAGAEAAGTAQDFASTVKDTAGRTAEQLRQTADAAADHLKRTASDAVSQAHERASQTYGAFQSRGSDAIDRARDFAQDAIDRGTRRYEDFRDRGGEHVARGQSAVERFVTENPVLVGVVGLAAGLLLGSLLPRTRREDEAVGPWADEVREQGMRYAREATERGRQFVETALDQAHDAATAAATAASDELRQQNEGTPRPGGPGIQTH